MAPASGATAPLSTFMSVDLPAPFSPTRAWASPGRRSRSTPLRAAVGPNDLRMPVMVRRAAVMVTVERCSWFSAPQGRNVIAQGNALGQKSAYTPALKGRYYFAPSGLGP